jgi:hypothetical protein
MQRCRFLRVRKRAYSGRKIGYFESFSTDAAYDISRHCVGADSLSLDAKIVHAKQP